MRAPPIAARLLAALEAAGRAARPWSWRTDSVLLLVLLLVTLVTRFIHASRYFYTVDSVLFSLATEKYDLMSLRPHPPGYPLFVALGWLMRHLVPEANRAFVLISIGFSVAAVGLLYGFLRRWVSLRAAFASTMLFSLAPSFFFNGTIALSYTAEAAGSVGIAWLAWETRRDCTPKRAAVLGAVWAVAAGVRQSLVLFLGPLVFFALLAAPRSPRELFRRGAAAGFAALATGLAWFVPAVQKTGGLASYRLANRVQGDDLVWADSVWRRGWAALSDHLSRMRLFFRPEEDVVAPVLALFALGAILYFASHRRFPTFSPPGRDRLAFLAVWILPSLAFYLFVFNGLNRGPIGYVLTLLPPLYMIFAWSGDAAIRGVERHGPSLPWRRAATLLALPLFLLPGVGLGARSTDLVETEVAAHDVWGDGWEKVHETFPANETAILVWYSWSHVKWYFPEYLSWVYFPSYKNAGVKDWVLTWQMQHREDEEPIIAKYLKGPGQPEHPIPSWVRTIIVFDFQLAGENGNARVLLPSVNVTEAHAQDWRLLVFHPTPDRPTIEGYLSDFRPAGDAAGPSPGA